MLIKNLTRLQEMVNRVSSVNSTLEKKKILSEYDELKKYIYYTYNPFKKFKVSSANVKKHSEILARELPVTNEDELFSTLDQMVSGKISGYASISTVKGILRDIGEDLHDIFLRILDKDLEIRLGVKEINNVWSGLIPEFSVALATKLENHEKDIDNNYPYYLSHKLDGVRCICIVDGEDIRFFSREGNEFLTLGKLASEIRGFCLKSPTVFDGEVCIMKGEQEDFQSIMKEIKKKDHEITHPRFLIFDMLSLEDFQNKKSKSTFSERQEKLHKVFSKVTATHCKVLEQLLYTPQNLEKLSEQATKENWEGLMLRKDTVYSGKRSKDILKIKKFFDDEYIVKDIETGPFRVVTEAGEKTIQTLSAVVIEHKGFDVRVGSGFSIADRELFYNNPLLIKGKTITVQYFEETENQDGGISLRFPTYKGLHGVKRNV